MAFDASLAAKFRVVLLAGEEDGLRRRALRDLVAASAADEFDVESISGDQTDPANWVAQVGTAPFLGDRRVLVVRNVLRCNPDSVPEDAFARLPGTALLVLVADEEGGADDRQRKLTSWLGKWRKRVESARGGVETFELASHELHSRLRAEATDNGKALSPRACDTLIAMTGGSLSRALEELDKAIFYVGAEKEIREADIKAVTIPCKEWNVFTLVDAALAGKAGEALGQLRLLVGSPAKAEDAAFQRIYPQVSRALRLLWQGRIVLDHRATVDNLPADVAALFPAKPNLASEKPYSQTKVMASARRVSLEAITSCMVALQDADSRLKGVLPPTSGVEALERLVLDMVAASQATV